MAGDPEENNKAMEQHLENMQKVHERQYPLLLFYIQLYILRIHSLTSKL